MKKIFVFGVTVVFLATFFSGLSIAQKTEENRLTITYNFAYPEIKKININGFEYDQITVKDAPCFGNPGEPFLPMKGAYILLPKNNQVKKITVTSNSRISFGLGYNIIPVSEIVPRSMILKSKSHLIKNEEIYSSENSFPNTLFSKVGSYNFRGYTILVLTLYPVQYKPSTGELFYYPEIRVDVTTVKTQKNNIFYRGLDEDKNEVLKKIDNPEILETYSGETRVKTDIKNQYDLLILTSNEFKNSFQPLKVAHENKGLKVEIKTLNDISIFPEAVTPEDIRDFVRKEYMDHGIEYLLLGGDADIIPDKILYVSGMDEDKWFYDTLMPVDQYYGYLDGPFNSDGDDRWGEPNDGENGGDVDLFAEVYVGRACVDTVEDVNNFVQKTASYLNMNYDEYLSKVILAGEYLGDYGVSSFGGNLLDPLIDGSDIDGFTTTGIPSEKYTIDTVYDRDWPGFTLTNPWSTGWEAEDLINRINTNVHIINHDGHSYYGYNMKMSNSFVDYFTNDKPCFVYSVGCMAGGFDDPEGYDCYAETITVKTDKGAFAGIWNARYGFFWSQRTDGDSSMYLRQFWDAVFGENIPIIGKANQDSKEDNLYLITRSCMRWTYYELNLFGDPSIAFHTSFPPEKPYQPLGPTNGKPGETYTFNSSTTDPDGDGIYYLFDWGDGSNTGWLGPYNSGYEIQTSHIWSQRGSYEVKVKAKDIHGIEGPWSDPLTIVISKNRAKMFLFQKIFRVIKKW